MEQLKFAFGMALNNFPGLQEYIVSLEQDGTITKEDLKAIADEYYEIGDLIFRDANDG